MMVVRKIETDALGYSLRCGVGTLPGVPVVRDRSRDAQGDRHSDLDRAPCTLTFQEWLVTVTSPGRSVRTSSPSYPRAGSRQFQQ